MTTQSLARQAVRVYPHQPYTNRKAVNTLRRRWIQKIEYLGPRWLLHSSNAVQRKQAGHIGDVAVFFVTLALGLFAMVAL